jgi:hypothetical protein
LVHCAHASHVLRADPSRMEVPIAGFRMQPYFSFAQLPLLICTR